MALQHDLLEQALHLARRERRRPKQASLRRAISAAYYALFHLLLDEGARALSPTSPATIRLRVTRAFAHADMKVVCRGILRTNELPQSTKSLITLPLQPELAAVASTFMTLQDEHHRADYDVSAAFERHDVLRKVLLVQGAFAAWARVRAQPNARVFLAALLLQKQWGR